MFNSLLSIFFTKRFDPPEKELLSHLADTPFPTLQKAVPEKAELDCDQPCILGTEQPVGPASALNRGEKYNDYHRVVLRINDKWRVIVCQDGIQWILQIRKGKHQGKPAWRARAYLTSKFGLQNYIREMIGEISGESTSELDKFPDRIVK